MSEAFEQVHDERARRIELAISWILRAGVTSSFAIILAGTILSFAHHADYLRDPAELKQLTRDDAPFPHTIHDVVRGVRELRGQAIVVAGLILLIATPVLRVAASIVGFVYQRDWLYVGITTVVLVLLLLSFALGRAEA